MNMYARPGRWEASCSIPEAGHGRRAGETGGWFFQRRIAVLAEASALVADSLDYAVTLKRLGHLMVPYLAHICSIDVVENGSLRHVTLVARDVERARLLRLVQARYPILDGFDLASVLQDPRSRIETSLSDRKLMDMAQSAEHLELLRRLRLGSYMLVPLMARGVCLGVLTLIADADSGRIYGAEDLALAEELANRAAVAVDNAHFLRERQRSERHLRHREARNRALIEAGAQIVWYADTQGHMVDGSASWCAFTGQSSAQARGDGWQDAVHPLDREGVATSWRMVLGECVPCEVEGRLQARDGHYRHFRLRAAPVLDGDGRVQEWVVVCADIHERKVLAAELQKLHADLEQRVAQRTLALETANHELESFSYSVSHDLRAPLRHISGFADLLRRNAADKLDSAELHYLDAIAESAHKMGKLIDDLLAFARTAQSDLRLARVDVAMLIDEIRHELQFPLDGRQVRWHLRDLPVVRADPALLKQVLVNLLGNALKYTVTRVEAHIEVGAIQNPYETVLYVKDNGVGFEMRYVDKLFGVFQRLHSSEEFEGTGIGLANVRRIVHRHGGRAWAEGAVDKGAIFYFTLPWNNVNGSLG